MRIENKIYFAPHHEFHTLNWDNPLEMIEPFRMRIHYYFLEPANTLLSFLDIPLPIEDTFGIAFAVGVICSTTIDFLAKLEFFTVDRVGKRYASWLEKNILGLNEQDPDNPNQTLGKRFYLEFRNGLVHEGRIKNAGQFSFQPDLFDPNSVLAIHEGAMVIHPGELLRQINQGLEIYLAEVAKNENKANQFGEDLRELFALDIWYSKRQRQL